MPQATQTEIFPWLFGILRDSLNLDLTAPDDGKWSAIPVSSQGTSEESEDSIPVSSQGTSEKFEDSIPVSSQGTSINYNISRFDSCIQPGHICWPRFQTRFLYLARARLKSSKIRFLYPARAHLLTTISRFDSCIQPGHICEQPIVDSIPVSSQGIST